MQALKLVDTATLTHDQWLDYRKTGIGGSDIAAILGKSQYDSPLSVYLQKLNLVPPKEQNDFMYFGNVLEPIVAQEFEKRSGMRVEVMSIILQHPLYPFLLANVDRVVIDETGYGILECKTASAYKQSEWEHGKVPEAYYWQIQHYLGVTGYKYAYAAALIGGNTFRYTYIERNQADIDYLTEKATDFWYMHIEPKTPPPVTYVDTETLGGLYKESDSEKHIDLLQDDENLMIGLWEAKNALKEAKQLEELAKNRLKEKMKDAEMCWYSGEKVASWKSNVNGTRVFKMLIKED